MSGVESFDNDNSLSLNIFAKYHGPPRTMYMSSALSNT